MKSKLVPIEDVLAWVSTNHPQIEVERERNWVWILTDIRELPEVRSSVKAFGFRFGRPHTCPSGRVGRWAHHCTKPLRFGSRPQPAEVPAPKQKSARKPKTTAPSAQGEVSGGARIDFLNTPIVTPPQVAAATFEDWLAAQLAATV